MKKMICIDASGIQYFTTGREYFVQDLSGAHYLVQNDIQREVPALKERFAEPVELVKICPECGSGDVRFCEISVRPYCADCGHWAPVNHGTRQDAIVAWNERVKKAHGDGPAPRAQAIDIMQADLQVVSLDQIIARDEAGSQARAASVAAALHQIVGSNPPTFGPLDWHEALDRSCMISEQFDRNVLDHPVIKANTELLQAATLISDLLGALYQQIGNLDPN